jgi:hypothetical protein
VYFPTLVRVLSLPTLPTTRCNAILALASRAVKSDKASKSKCEMPRRASSRESSVKRRTQFALTR